MDSLNAGPAPPGAPVRSTFETDDPLAMREVIDHAYGASLQRVDAVPAGDCRMRLDRVQAGDLVVGELRLPTELSFGIEGGDEVVVVTVLDGDGGHVIDGVSVSAAMGPGDVYLGVHPGAVWTARSRRSHTHTVSLPGGLIGEVAARSAEESSPAVEFRSLEPVTGGHRQWRHATRYVDGLLGDPMVTASPLLIGPATRMLAATALAIFPNTAIAAVEGADRRDARDAALRRSVAFIDANPDLDITLADVARAAHVTSRAVQLAFRRHLETTPMAYLRRVRLDRARQELGDAAPEDGLTVARVAVTWGFANPSRFAAHYRAEFGELPSETLAR